MKIKYSELRRDYTLDYSFDGEIITINYNNQLTDTFDLSQLAEGDKFQGVETEIPVKIFDSVERIDGELKIVLFKPHGNRQKIKKYHETDWETGINNLQNKINEIETKKAAANDKDLLKKYNNQIYMYETVIDRMKKERAELKEYCETHGEIPNTDWQVV